MPIPKISRRTCLKASGLSLALPWLEVMADDPTAPKSPAPTSRMVFIYIPYGVNGENWFPKQTGTDFELPKSMRPLNNLRDQFTVLSGLQYLSNRTGGHNGCVNWLSGAHVTKANPRFSKSFDQVCAQELGAKTRHSSLQIATPLRGNTAATLSYDLIGRPIQPLRNPQEIFNHLFQNNDPAAKKMKENIQLSFSIIGVASMRHNAHCHRF